MEQTDYIIFVVRSEFISQAARIVIKSNTFFSFLLLLDFLLSVWQAAGLGALATKGVDCWGNYNNSKKCVVLYTFLFFRADKRSGKEVGTLSGWDIH